MKESHILSRGVALQIDALRKKLRILIDHNSHAPDLEKFAS